VTQNAPKSPTSTADTGADQPGGWFERLPSRHRDTFRPKARIVRVWAGVSPDLQTVLDRLLAGTAPWPLYLWGPIGTGKTRAALCACDRVDGGRYWTVSGVMDQMQDRCAPWYRLNDPALAVLDELGAHRARDFEFDAVKEFLDWREDQPAIYISNHPPAKMREAYDDRIESRLQSGTVFELSGRDRRRM